MPSVTDLLSGAIRGVAVVSPRLGGAMAYRAFFSTAPRMRVHPRDASTHDAARTGALSVGGRSVTTYEWGSGRRTVLLLHGWRGRASQFAPLVRELVAEGFRVVSFDAPAHGSSDRGPTDVRDWLDAATHLHETHGPFESVIGHSFGAFAALTAARTTVPTPAVVAIAGAASPVAFIDQFARDVGLSARTVDRMTALFRARLGVDEAQLAERYDAAQHPLPDGTALLVAHDRDDRRMPDGDSLRLHAAHDGRSRLLRTEGLGHTRILRADLVLDAVLDQVRGTARHPSGQNEGAA